MSAETEGEIPGGAPARHEGRPLRGVAGRHQAVGTRPRGGDAGVDPLVEGRARPGRAPPRADVAVREAPALSGPQELIACAACGVPRRASHYRPDGRAKAGREPICCACGGGYPKKGAKRAPRARPKPEVKTKTKARENQATPRFRPSGGEGGHAGPEGGYSRGSAAWARQQQREHMERSRLRAEAAARFAARGGG